MVLQAQLDLLDPPDQQDLEEFPEHRDLQVILGPLGQVDHLAQPGLLDPTGLKEQRGLRDLQVEVERRDSRGPPDPRVPQVVLVLVESKEWLDQQVPLEPQVPWVHLGHPEQVEHLDRLVLQDPMDQLVVLEQLDYQVVQDLLVVLEHQVRQDQEVR